MDKNESGGAMLPEGMGNCPKHGSFDLREGCAGCLAEKKVEGSPKPVAVSSSVVNPAVASSEPTTKKKELPDYSKTAECLCNPATVKKLLDALHKRQQTLFVIREHLPPKVMRAIAHQEEKIAELNKEIREAVEQHGSYQDIEAGEYAVKYRRIHKEFNAGTFAEKFPEYPTAIKKAVDVSKLQGLIRGGLITEDELKVKGILTEEQTFAFYIK